MIMPMNGTFTAVLIVMIIFIMGYKIKLPNQWLQRALPSFSAGVAIAYVFAHLIPQLEEAKNILIEYLVNRSFVFSKYVVYLSAMLGFVAFYGLEKMVDWQGARWQGRLIYAISANEVVTFFFHLVGYILYVCIMSYLMVRNIESAMVPVLFYIIAMGFHFFCLTCYFHDEHGYLYARVGRYLLAAAALTGWLLGALSTLHKVLVIVLLGLVSGAIIMNTMLMELPKNRSGQFIPFFLGSIVYALLLLI